MRRNRRVKILATLGPASSKPETIEALFRAGADVFRINMSHTDHEALKERIRDIRLVERSNRRPIGALVDLQGPKHRLGTFKAERVELSPGDRIAFDCDPAPGDESRVHLPHPEILKALRVGHRILVDDGRVKLKAVECAPERVVAELVSGTKLSDRKGVSLPDTEIDEGALTEKDREDLDAALELGADWIALSFVQRAEDLKKVKEIVQNRAGVLAKIEKPQALEHFDSILDLADAIMVARGDLGVEAPIQSVPGIQKQLVRKCRVAGKPVVIATQMLESMISEPAPTRAEVSDVANAVFEGADAVMLSAESAAGNYPVEAVAMMDAIARQVEKDPTYSGIIAAQRGQAEATGADAISLAARQIAETLSLSAIVCYTASGTTGLRAARERPSRPVIALSPVQQTGRRLALAWGLHCVITEDADDLDDMVERACRIAVADKFASAGDRIIITAGIPFRTPGSTNLIRIAFVE